MDAAADSRANARTGLEPLLAQQDFAALASYLQGHYPPKELRAFLTDPSPQLIKASVTCLATTGTMADTPSVARLLHHADAEIVNLAENTLWSIWLRAGGASATAALVEAMEAMNDKAYAKATHLLDKVIRQYPNFAEAYNQRAFAWFLSDKHLRSVADCRRALALNPWHFGAAANLGHSYAELGFYERSLDAYHAALRLHPRMEGVRDAMRKVREILHNSSRARHAPD